MSWPTLLKLSVKVPRKALNKTVQATGVLKNIYLLIVRCGSVEWYEKVSMAQERIKGTEKAYSIHTLFHR